MKVLPRVVGGVPVCMIDIDSIRMTGRHLLCNNVSEVLAPDCHSALPQCHSSPKNPLVVRVNFALSGRLVTRPTDFV
jgi:hypothetical protein